MNTKTADAGKVETAQMQSTENLPATTTQHKRSPAIYAPGDKGSLVAASKNVAEAVSNIMAEIAENPVEKKGVNTFHNYKYAKIQDILQALVPLMGKHGIIVTQTEVSRAMFDNDNAISITYEFTIAHKSGEVWPEKIVQTGLCNCRTSKGTFDDKAINKTHTAARKYFMLSLFQIPTEDENDPDRGDNDDGGRSHQGGQQQRRVPSAQPSGQQDKGFTTSSEMRATKPDANGKISNVGHSVNTWVPVYIEAIKAAKTPDEINLLDKANDEILGTVHAKAHDLYKQIEAAVAAKVEEFKIGASPRPSQPPSPEGNAKAAGVTETTAKATAEADASAAPAAEKIPTAKDDPEGFLAWAKTKLDAVAKADDLAAAIGEIEEQTKGIFPPDREELSAMVKAAEKRLEP